MGEIVPFKPKPGPPIALVVDNAALRPGDDVRSPHHPGVFRIVGVYSGNRVLCRWRTREGIHFQMLKADALEKVWPRA